MYLKRLEIQGFKSFPENTLIEFDTGMTAIVGPNGSGKSNVTDAVRWVLGEQSAKSLRGGKMEDVIFNGTSTRKAMNYAEVTLTLDNADKYIDYDFPEIQITRRLYRSGAEPADGRFDPDGRYRRTVHGSGKLNRKGHGAEL